MYVKCWQCFEEIDTLSVEKRVYESVINYMRGFLCDNAKDDECDLWWRHEDCHVVSVMINEFKEKYEIK